MIGTLYRFIKSAVDTNGGSRVEESSVYMTFSEAYTQCIPADERNCCRMLRHAVEGVFDAGKTLISVSHVSNNNRLDVYWIQVITYNPATQTIESAILDNPLPTLSGEYKCCVWPPRGNITPDTSDGI